MDLSSKLGACFIAAAAGWYGSGAYCKYDAIQSAGLIMAAKGADDKQIACIKDQLNERVKTIASSPISILLLQGRENANEFVSNKILPQVIPTCMPDK